ncbi:MAG TPA: flagellar biosynthesis protein FlhF [Bacteroidetes bacterium]|nr:flagellar biosynthesis protein FlhF [Bacteroidota bacterium]
MKIKKFTAENSQGALQKIRQALGEDAILLSMTEKYDRQSRKRYVIATAAIDEEYGNEKGKWPQKMNPIRPGSGSAGPEERFSLDESNSAFTYSRKNFVKKPVEQQTSRAVLSPDFSELQEVRERIDSLSLLLQGTGYPEMPPDFIESYARLIKAGVNKQLAGTIIHNTDKKMSRQGRSSRKYIKREISATILKLLESYPFSSRADPADKKIKVMIGPTGVGKTTCIAKLSAIDKIYQQQKVGLISIDTYRIAAIEQLRTYANITKLPLEVVYSPAEMQTALTRLSDCEVIYIDTPGKSPQNGAALKEMLTYFRDCPSPETHLVLSLTSKEEYMKDVVERFSIFPLEKILFTKMDETGSFGSILGVLHKAKKPISFIATGQNVPDDIMKPGNDLLTKMMMGEKP